MQNFSIYDNNLFSSILVEKPEDDDVDEDDEDDDEFGKFTVKKSNLFIANII